MHRECWLAGVMLAVAACSSSEVPEDQADGSGEGAHEAAFDPLIETLDRARATQQAIDSQAAELRRRIEDAEGQRD